MLQLNIDNLLKNKNKSRYWLFNQLNTISPISYTNFLNIIDNRTKSIKYENIEKLCKILECEPNDLFINVKH